MVARRKQFGPGKTCDAANKENEVNNTQDVQQEIFNMDPWENPPNVKHKISRTASEQADYDTLTEVRHTVFCTHIFSFVVVL